MKTKLIKLICGLALLGSALTAPAQLFVFSGTPGSTPVSLSLSSSLNFTITNAASSGEFILFDIKNLFSSSDGSQNILNSFTSYLQYDVNGGTLHNIAGWVDDNYASGAVSSNDGYLYATLSQNLNPGDVITLNAGTLTSSGNAPVSFNLGTSGNYEMFIADANLGLGGLAISSLAVTATPEPSTIALAGLGGMSALAMFRRRK